MGCMAGKDRASAVPASSPQDPANAAKLTRAITDSSRQEIGQAPLAPRPDWLPATGPGQANVHPLRWSLTIQQWILFVRACVATETWKALTKVKGEYAITMYDLQDHFVKPWTAGTGCSVALLMNAAEQLPVEGMFSHAWAGSVVETYNCLQNAVNHSGVPSTARFFFCTFSMYQPGDGALGGLSISEQIALEPFARIIESKPTHGMFVLHTTLSEVYNRLWVAHEADVGIDAKLQMRGLFDMYRWTVEKFEAAATVKTKDGMCGVEKDRAYIEALISERGGYDRLDRVIADFRAKMFGELKVLLQSQTEGADLGGPLSQNIEKQYDWKCTELICCQGEEYPGANTQYFVDWSFESRWSFHLLGVQVHAMPLGAQSYPFAEALERPEKKRLAAEADKKLLEEFDAAGPSGYY